MSIHKHLKGRPDAPKAPRDVSVKIIAQLPDNELIVKTEIAGPGFINAFLSPEWVQGSAGSSIRQVADPQTIVCDFSSPNIAKEMHVGHLRSTIIGESLVRVLEFMGHKVHRINHVGDWGTQFGMLINHLRTAYPDFLENPPNISDLTGFYKEAKKRFDDDDDFKEKSRQSVVTLQSGDEYSLKCWKVLCDISRIQFKAVYDRLHCSGLVEQGESFYNSRIPAVVEELTKKGMVELSDGARIIHCGRNFPLMASNFPLMAVKSDGGFGHDSMDLAAMKANRVIYVTDSGQGDHFEMIFIAARNAGWCGGGVRLDHVPFGLVLGDDKKKFKTRSGEVTKLVDLLDEAVKRSRTELEERANKEGSTSQMESAQLADASEKIGYGCVKYADLRQHRISDYQFSYEKMLDLKGNTAVYLMYSYARICSIAAKAGVTPAELKGVQPSLGHPKEYALVTAVLKFADVIERVADQLLPHLICEFLYDVAEKFSEFYRDCHVVGDPLQNQRLVICEGVAVTMKKAMFLLGITPIDKI
ncbi:tRNA synthetases class I (R)-domain-containing protein [Baffinella frigidus]|nr:tRNA synthetases class I (R)-domain-containing protein [Cryptophyta sp. CCMP2293]